MLQTITEITNWLNGNHAVIYGILGFIITMAKITPTSASGKVMTVIQGFLDMVGDIAVAVGNMLKAAADVLAHIIKSDGAGGTP